MYINHVHHERTTCTLPVSTLIACPAPHLISSRGNPPHLFNHTFLVSLCFTLSRPRSRRCRKTKKHSSRPWFPKERRDGSLRITALNGRPTITMSKPNANPLLASYRAEQVAGNYHRMQAGGIDYLFAEKGDGYGPSQKAYQEWKKSGFPTAERMQSTTFGLSTRRGETAGDALTFTHGNEPPPDYARAPAGKPVTSRPNPITWQGGEPEVQSARARAQPSQYDHMKAQYEATRPPPPPAALSPEQMHETWGHVLRTQKTNSYTSAAQCMIQMPPEYRTEAPPPMPTLGNDQSLLTIGLHPHNKPVRRSSAFTSDFRDPFL
jgi:hypothetical protein